jgi:hypothetical protein
MNHISHRQHRREGGRNEAKKLKTRTMRLRTSQDTLANPVFQNGPLASNVKPRRRTLLFWSTTHLGLCYQQVIIIALDAENANLAISGSQNRLNADTKRYRTLKCSLSQDMQLTQPTHHDRSHPNAHHESRPQHPAITAPSERGHEWPLYLPDLRVAQIRK